MTDRRTPSRVAGAFVAAVVLTILMMAGSAQAASASVEPPPTEPETSEPETTEPGTSEPETTGPDTSEPDAATDGDTDAVILAAIAFVALIGVAAVWMMRRPNGDDAPHPPPPARDQPLPGQDLF
jgi:hypothetical protein